MFRIMRVYLPTKQGPRLVLFIAVASSRQRHPARAAIEGVDFKPIPFDDLDNIAFADSEDVQPLSAVDKGRARTLLRLADLENPNFVSATLCGDEDGPPTFATIKRVTAGKNIVRVDDRIALSPDQNIPVFLILTWDDVFTLARKTGFAPLPMGRQLLDEYSSLKHFRPFTDAFNQMVLLKRHQKHWASYDVEDVRGYRTKTSHRWYIHVGHLSPEGRQYQPSGSAIREYVEPLPAMRSGNLMTLDEAYKVLGSFDISPKIDYCGAAWDSFDAYTELKTGLYDKPLPAFLSWLAGCDQS
ncbi:hypothetical protein NEOLEDRAFT_1151828 [Neolentinus lepideus HHB14362 ss-1]|uniref:Uncharacterized protein n=1 Tax=Neolentinus lepideus HHB14362 ss-1 TaxID=1314782 RepID=A0A165NJ75_9AGAM|nr:hypothetical protein NEOLEDRAFT_1151828 [Neolentinus lepideus HHB14362 ss-1]